MANRDQAREEILARVRSALRDRERTPRQSIPRSYARQRPSTDLVALFHERVADYQATVRRVDSDAVADVAASILLDHGARRVLAAHGIPRLWWESLAERFERVEDGTFADTATLDTMDGVVTTAAVGIASTGTIVLDHGTGQGRRAATLIPDLHVCVVATEQIVDDIPAALARLDPARPLTFISGPSATSDIELDRVEGVHGPRHLHVLLTPESTALDSAVEPS